MFMLSFSFYEFLRECDEFSDTYSSFQEIRTMALLALFRRTVRYDIVRGVNVSAKISLFYDSTSRIITPLI